MKIIIQVPFSYFAERVYILSLLFHEFLGLDIDIERTSRQDTSIRVGEVKRLIVSDGLFACPEREWLTPSSLPRTPLPLWDTRELGSDIPLVTSQVPILYGNRTTEGRWFHQNQEEIRLGIDVFGSAFFMLTRYEEVVKPDRDAHGRFPSSSSVALKEGFLDRPIVNEYLEILWACMRRLWPDLKRKQGKFRTIIGHDVDYPFLHAFASPFQTLISCAGDIVLRQEPRRATQRWRNWVRVKKSDLSADPYNTFDLLMEIAERHDTESTFYFIVDPRSKVDCNYSITHPLIRKLLHQIHDRGHKIGLHASYHSYLDARQTRKEYECLRELCLKEGIQQEEWGSRQHFLRWQTPVTFKNLNDAGLDYDATLSYADHAGFRCGVCYEYPVFHVLTREVLRLRERPLIVMDGTITDKQYMGLGNGETAAAKIKEYKSICRRFNGTFTLLWHNHRMVNPLDVALYQMVLEG